MTETTASRQETSSHPMVLLSYKLKSFVEFFGQNGAFFILPLVGFTMLDVFGRKMTNQTVFGFSIDAQLWLVENVSRMFQSTMLQELEWHVHTALFSLVLGYGFTRNRLCKPRPRHLSSSWAPRFS